MKRIILVLGLISVNLAVIAQEADSNKFTFSAVSLNFGVQSVSNNFGNELEKFKALAPNSTLLKNDFSDYNSNSLALTDASLGIGVNLHFTKPTDKRYNSEFRIGISKNKVSIYNTFLFNEEETRVDTLRSSSSGNEYYVDSIVRNNYSMNYKQEQVFINFDYTIGSQKANRFRYYIGAGIGLGYNFGAYTDINYSTHSRLESSVDNINSLEYSNFKVQNERVENKNSFNARFYVPIGLDLKLSRTNEKWNKTHLFFEFTPSMTYADIPEIESKTYFNSNTAIGFRYDFK